MATKQTEHIKKEHHHKKKTSQGCGRGTRFGRSKGSLKKHRGQGGKRKSIKR